MSSALRAPTTCPSAGRRCIATTLAAFTVPSIHWNSPGKTAVFAWLLYIEIQMTKGFRITETAANVDS